MGPILKIDAETEISIQEKPIAGVSLFSWCWKFSQIIKPSKAWWVTISNTAEGFEINLRASKSSFRTKNSRKMTYDEAYKLEQYFLMIKAACTGQLEDYTNKARLPIKSVVSWEKFLKLFNKGLKKRTVSIPPERN